MKTILSKRAATYGILLLIAPMIVFHLLVLTGVIPSGIVWGGRLSNRAEMIRFEMISIFSLLFIGFIVAVNAGFLSIKIKPVILKTAIWLIVVLFLLNTLGNLTAATNLERNLFTPVTLLLFVFSLRLALSK